MHCSTMFNNPRIQGFMKKLTKLKTPALEQTLSAELLGQAIKARRTQSGLRLEDAAALCGVAKQTFMKIEHGNPTSRLQSILQICAALGIKIHIAPWQDESENSDDWK
jgi:DNA-binding XRE family transcriptional regulator